MTGEISILPPVKKKNGGPRPGSGRKRGSQNAKTRLIAEEAKAKGITPIDVMLKNMRFYDERAEKFTDQLEKMAQEITPEELKAGGEKLMDVLKIIQKVGDWRMKAQSCAVDAAPYVHPKLTSIAVKMDNGDSKRPMLDITPDLTPKVAAERYAAYLAAQ